MFSDLNEIVDSSETFGGKHIWKKKLFLKNFIHDVAGFDLKFIGGHFTWDNHQRGQVLIRERLDRAFTDRLWLERNPQALIKHLNFEESDHCPILIRTEGEYRTQKRPFRFFKAWTTDKSSSYVVDNAWNSDWHPGLDIIKLKRSLSETTKALRIWNKTVFGFADKQIQEFEMELKSLQQTDKQKFDKEHQILDKLSVFRARWESILRQKSRQMWLKEGDRNTNFFHASLLVRRRMNRVQAIKENQEWIYDHNQFSHYFIKSFQELYNSEK